jgi:hypothetical protein
MHTHTHKNTNTHTHTHTHTHIHTHRSRSISLGSGTSGSFTAPAVAAVNPTSTVKPKMPKGPNILQTFDRSTYTIVGCCMLGIGLNILPILNAFKAPFIYYKEEERVVVEFAVVLLVHAICTALVYDRRQGHTHTDTHTHTRTHTQKKSNAYTYTHMHAHTHTHTHRHTHTHTHMHTHTCTHIHTHAHTHTHTHTHTQAPSVRRWSRSLPQSATRSTNGYP